jgi:hypothetical protein
MRVFRRLAAGRKHKNQIIIWTQTLNQRVSSYKKKLLYGRCKEQHKVSQNPELDKLIDLDYVTEFGPEKERIAHRCRRIVSASFCAV